MKRNDVKRLHSLSVTELQSQLAQVQRALEQARQDLFLGRLKNVRLVRSLRKDIARIKTVLSAKGM